MLWASTGYKCSSVIDIGLLIIVSHLVQHLCCYVWQWYNQWIREDNTGHSLHWSCLAAIAFYQRPASLILAWFSADISVHSFVLQPYVSEVPDCQSAMHWTCSSYHLGIQRRPSLYLSWNNLTLLLLSLSSYFIILFWHMFFNFYVLATCSIYTCTITNISAYL